MMKKIFFSLMILFLLVSCTPIEEEGDYKEGVYFGSAVDNFGTESSVATAVVYVNEHGLIKSVFLDTTHVKDDVLTTKKVLGKDYNMIVASPIGKEWDEQVKTLEKKIIEEQGLAWLKWSNDEQTKTDSISGVTMQIDALYKAVNYALSQAK